MSAEDPAHENVSPPAAAAPLRPGRPLLAWCVIAAVAGFVVWQHSRPEPRAAKTIAANRLVGAIADWEVRYIVGAAGIFPQKEQFAAAAPVDAGPMEQRLRGVIIVGELSGPKAAAKKLQSLEKTLEEQHAPVEFRDTAEALRRLYGDLAAGKPRLPSLDPDDRKRLTDRLGWSGRLALHPAGGAEAEVRQTLLAEARRTIVKSLLVLGAFGLLTLAGMGALAAIVLLLLIRPQSRKLAPSTSHGGIYAETFALWIVLYIALSYAASWLPVGANRLLLIAAVMLASLTALAWPVLRGVSWRVACDEIGLQFTRKPLAELALGLVAYVAALPMLIVGVLLVVALAAMQQRLTGEAGMKLGQDLPSHPIVVWLLDSSLWQKAQVMFLASVMAPLMEETMFRGALYRHLRDATRRLGYAASVLSSGLAVSFLFAVIHPQGLIATPVLMALAFAFTLAREWRGTLLPAMAAHGINNFLATCLLIAIS